MKSEPKNPKVPTMRANLMKTRPVPAALVVVLASWTGAALAQTAPAAAPLPAMTAPAKPVFAIRGFDITGDNPLGGSETTRILAPFLRADATMDTLQKATAALEAALKARGYALHRVVLPPQSVADAVQLQIVKFVHRQGHRRRPEHLRCRQHPRQRARTGRRAAHPISARWRCRQPLPTRARARTCRSR
jgi:hypothetical protein